MNRRHTGRHRELSAPASWASEAPRSASSPAPPPSAFAGPRLGRTRLDLGLRRTVREQRQLVDQHRQRLLRRPAVHPVHLGRLRRPAVRLAGRPGHQGPADRGRRADPGRPGLGRLGLRLRRRWRGREHRRQLVKQRLDRQRRRRTAPRRTALRRAAPPADERLERLVQRTISGHSTGRPRRRPAPTSSPPTCQQQRRPAPGPTDAAPASAADGTYTVVSGDTLSEIAAANGVAGGWEALYAANSDVISNADLIYPGQVLRLG